MEFNKDAVLQAEASKKNGLSIGINGNVLEIANAVLNVVGSVYKDIKRESRVESHIFKALVSGVLSDQQSPVWDEKTNEVREFVDVSALEKLFEMMEDNSCGPME